MRMAQWLKEDLQLFTQSPGQSNLTVNMNYSSQLLTAQLQSKIFLFLFENLFILSVLKPKHVGIYVGFEILFI